MACANGLICRLEPRLNSCSQRPEIAHALHFVIRQLDIEMLFQAREHFKSLQAIDSEFLEKIVAGRKRCARHLEMLCREIQNFIGGLVDRPHE
jgi:hypothetical protein